MHAELSYALKFDGCKSHNYLQKCYTVPVVFVSIPAFVPGVSSAERSRSCSGFLFWLEGGCWTVPKNDAELHQCSAGWRSGNVAPETSRAGSLLLQSGIKQHFLVVLSKLTAILLLAGSLDKTTPKCHYYLLLTP